MAIVSAAKQSSDTIPRYESGMVVETWPAANVTPYPGNPRKINERAVIKVAASLREFGWRQPIVVDEAGVIIVGHTRLQAAIFLGLTEAPVHIAKGLTEAQIKAYRLADNRTNQEASWDMDLLSLEIGGLTELDYDLSLTGFDLAELTALTEWKQGETDEDDTPALQDVAVSKPGDLWEMGGHRLLCGDCTVATDVARLLGTVKPMLMVTDPPYGVEYDANWRNETYLSDGTPVGASAIGKVTNDARADWSEAWALFPGDVAYVWHADKASHLVAESLLRGGLEIRAQIIWAKNNIVIGRGHYHSKHEPCWYAVRKTGKGHWVGGRKQSTVWNIDKPMKSETGHSTQKPVECMRRPIANNSSPGQVIYEPFSGSGTTIIAAETAERLCFAIEVEPCYVDMAVRRWQEFTGKEATLEGDGRTFNEAANGP